MTTHTPLRCANSVMSADPGASSGSRVVLLDTGNYPSYSNYLNETWTFSGTDWTNTGTILIDPNGPLPGRINATMAYDGYNVMLFGGQSASSTGGILNDTWTWSGLIWVKRAPSNVPFGRYKAEAAYLAGVGTVMFGGANLLYNTLETWIWDGYHDNWNQITITNGTGPGARTGHVMAASSSQVILFGGQGTNSLLNSTWSFNGTTWTKLTPTISPSVRSEACMAYDSINNIWVMFGGANEYNYLNETWTFNGTTWSQVVVANGVGPAGRVGAQMCFDTQSGTTIMYGGISATDNYPSDATWSFNGSTLTWTKL